MPDRGAVFRLVRRLGFGEGTAGGAVVVIQAAELNAVLPTTIIVPLDVATDLHASPACVPVSATEAGSTVDHVALPTHVRVIALDRLAPGAIGRLRSDTLFALDETLRAVLGL